MAAGARLLEYSWGRPPEYVIPELPQVVDEDDIRNMPTAQLLALVRESSRSEGSSTGDATGASAHAQDEEQPRRP